MDENVLETLVKKDDNGNEKVISEDHKNVERQVHKAMDIFDDIFDEMIWRASGGMTF